MAKTFDDFTEDASINPSPSPGDPPYWMANADYFVGFTSTAPGGERKWSLSAVKEDFKYAFPQLNGVTMTVLIDGATGNKVFPSNPSYLTSIPFTIVSTSKSNPATYTLTFGTGVFLNSNYAFFTNAYTNTQQLFCYATTKTSTSLVLNCVNSAGTATAPTSLSVHIVAQP